MQQAIRNSNPDDFPMHQRFVDFKEHGDLVAPEIVASQLFELITNQKMEQSGSRFDVEGFVIYSENSGNGHKPTHSQRHEADPWLEQTE